MRLHHRERIVNQASLKLYDASKIYDDRSYEDMLYAYHTVESYWLVSFMSGEPREETAKGWQEFIHDAQDDPDADEEEKETNALIVAYGQAVAEIIVEYELTLGEIVAIFASHRATAAKYIIRTERHPEDDDKPGGIE